ncbi:helix-turn-helix transcriptional regulator [Mesorhizobium sp. BE184]|uniref:helix-turn-helix transcriptional regulator n=1 Tax=Mesorhizobium sp. BE184 TaxID=2817714 RepID=UPI0028561D15|nr:helix-turn-helix transcriptional regulator [Mesorhizobium sp. BE184]MDR7033601.1 DNA-binding CsgD family transcriptional regulator [Mesorhizobium sp. BE184]
MWAPVIDRIYEAAFVPELWPETLQEIAVRTGSVSGEFQLITDSATPRWQATDVTRPVMDDFMASGMWRRCMRPQVLLELNHAGFLCDHDYMDAGQLAADPAYEVMGRIGLGWQLGTLIPMPTGEVVGVTFERWVAQGKPGQDEIDRLDELRPHLARGGLIAARLQLERARETVSALEALGLPAAVMSASGKVRATNSLFEALPEVFLPRAFDQISVAVKRADDMVRDAIQSLSDGHFTAIRSIPLAATVERQPLVIHVLPIRRSAYDVFSGSDVIIAATMVSASNLVPSPSILTGLFDLSPAEAKLATALAAGTSLNDAAMSASIKLKTARTYLERIFAKTGTHRQSELVALLKSTAPLS